MKARSFMAALYSRLYLRGRACGQAWSFGHARQVCWLRPCHRALESTADKVSKQAEPRALGWTQKGLQLRQSLLALGFRV